MRLFLIFLLLFPNLVLANCYVIGDLKGYSVRESDDYKIDKDGISSQKFLIEINGKNSNVSPSNMRCMQAGDNTLLCVDKTAKGQSTIETWSVYPAKNIAIYTKSINGYGSFNGANMFVGKIKGRCN